MAWTRIRHLLPVNHVCRFEVGENLMRGWYVCIGKMGHRGGARARRAALNHLPLCRLWPIAKIDFGVAGRLFCIVFRILA